MFKVVPEVPKPLLIFLNSCFFILFLLNVYFFLLQITDLDQKEEMHIQPEQNEETRIQKNEERLRNLWDNFKCSNIQIIGVSEGEKEEQEIENLF